MIPTVLYLYCDPTHQGRIAGIQASTFAGIRRYASARGWQAVAWSSARPEKLAAFLEKHHPVAGCIVDCSDDAMTLKPSLFGRLPLVYIHADPALFGQRITRLVVDHEAVARTAFRELSAGMPTAYAVLGAHRKLSWSCVRERFFRSFVATAGAKCHVFPHDIANDVRASRLVEWISALPRRTAVFAVNDFTASEVIAAARSAGRRIPADLTLCGVDNVKGICEASFPTITSIQRDIELEGYSAARTLESSKKNRTISVEPLMAVWRDSTLGLRKTASSYILSAVEMIRREASGGLTAGEVVAASPISRSLFNLRFREAMGHSVHDEIEHVRLEKVFTLLAYTDTAIGAISGMCGYRSNIALHKAFRLRTGISMREWRLRNRRKL